MHHRSILNLGEEYAACTIKFVVRTDTTFDAAKDPDHGGLPSTIDARRERRQPETPR